jgi:hypothetical protein
MTVHVMHQLPVPRHELNRANESIPRDFVRELDHEEVICIVSGNAKGFFHFHDKVGDTERGTLRELWRLRHPGGIAEGTSDLDPCRDGLNFRVRLKSAPTPSTR